MMLSKHDEFVRTVLSVPVTTPKRVLALLLLLSLVLKQACT
jgi:hypothetical protein